MIVTFLFFRMSFQEMYLQKIFMLTLQIADTLHNYFLFFKMQYMASYML